MSRAAPQATGRDRERKGRDRGVFKGDVRLPRCAEGGEGEGFAGQ